MTAAREDALSPDELRKKLYQTFKSKGVLDTLKTQLRNQLIQELKHPLLGGGEPVPGPVSSRSTSLLVTASNTIVADYLKSSGYEYTLSVFFPESGLRKDKILGTKDLLQFIKMSHHSPLHKLLTSNESDVEIGFLTGLLTHLAEPRGSRSDADTQTTSTGNYRDSLVDKMKLIDREYEGLHHRGDKGTSFESKLAEHKRELETQMHAEMKVKMRHFKDVELAKVRLEEQARSHKEFANFRQDLEKTYEMKANALMNREKNAIERLQKQQELEETNVYTQRQTLLKEIEKVRNRENDLKLRMEGFEKTCELHSEKTKVLEDLLRRRELAVRTSEETYDQKLLQEVSRYKLELKEEFLQRTEQLTENEKRNQVEKARVQEESATLAAQAEEHLQTCAALHRVQGALEASEQRAALLDQQKELMSARLEAVSDYSGLKREKVELQAELRLLRRQLEEAQEESRLLRAEAARPSEAQLGLQEELQRLQEELQRLQGARRQEQEEFDKQRQVLQAQLLGEVERCAHLKAQLMEVEARSHWLTTQAEEMKIQLRQTQTAGAPQRGRALPRWAPSVSPEPEETPLLAGAKARIRELEREAETLEEAYRSYQQRAVRAPVPPPRPYSPPPPPRPYSPPPPAQTSRHTAPPPPRRPAPARSLRPPSPRKTQTSGTPFSPPPQHQHISQPSGTLDLDLDLNPGAMPPWAWGASDPDLRSLAEPPSVRRTPPHSPSPSRCLSSTPLPELSPEGGTSPVGRPPPAPLRDQTPPSERDFSPDLSPPQAPQLQSTARDQTRSQSPQPAFPSSSEYSPQPEKIHLEDLSTSLPEPRSIPELLLDTAVPLPPEGAPPGGRDPAPPQPAPLETPGTPLPRTGQEDEAPLESAEEEEHSRETWERREREERRRWALEEAKQREQEELSRLERETTLLEEKNAGRSDGEEEKEEDVLGGRQGQEEKEAQEEQEEQEEAPGGRRSPAEDPLQKYMKMVLEARAQKVQSPVRAEPGGASPEAGSLSEERDDSIAVFSHEAADDDFW